jgi:hypothetical protein
MATPESLFISSDIEDIVDIKTVTAESQLTNEPFYGDITDEIRSAWIDDNGKFIVTIQGSVSKFLHSLLNGFKYQVRIGNQKYQCKVIKIEKNNVYLQMEVENAGI